MDVKHRVRFVFSLQLKNDPGEVTGVVVVPSRWVLRPQDDDGVEQGLLDLIGRLNVDSRVFSYHRPVRGPVSGRLE